MDKQTQPPVSSEQTPFRGLYKHVKISVKALDIIIAVCIGLILLLVALDLRNPGFTISFDSRGGTACAPMKYYEDEQIYGLPTPTKEGYTFGHWENKWGHAILDGALLTADNIVLYAVWIEP